jgi:hypothetical protein
MKHTQCKEVYRFENSWLSKQNFKKIVMTNHKSLFSFLSIIIFRLSKFHRSKRIEGHIITVTKLLLLVSQWESIEYVYSLNNFVIVDPFISTSFLSTTRTPSSISKIHLYRLDGICGWIYFSSIDQAIDFSSSSSSFCKLVVCVRERKNKSITR